MAKMKKTIELITAGRAGIDLNTTVLNASFADTPSFKSRLEGRRLILSRVRRGWA